jgi:gamma-glutamylcyclotransferase (GGCT)/AIG2-like uncharacterized protein YtfP
MFPTNKNPVGITTMFRPEQTRRGGRQLSTLYFAYTALISPERLGSVTTDAEFMFIAHLPETKLVFPMANGMWDGSLPSVRAEAGNTVWGAVFELASGALAAIDEVEAEEGRVQTQSFKAVDREGRRHAVVTHAHTDETHHDRVPSREYMSLIVQGGRHWGLPTGWVAGLEEYVEEPLF